MERQVRKCVIRSEVRAGDTNVKVMSTKVTGDKGSGAYS